MNKIRFNFTDTHDDMKYNPKKKTFSYYQICSLVNPKTGKHPVRKFIYNELNEIQDVLEKDYAKKRLDKFIEATPKNKFRIYPTNDLALLNRPSSDEILSAQSELLNT